MEDIRPIETKELSESQIDPDYRVFFCYTCGAQIPAENAYCGKCGQERRTAGNVRRLSMALRGETAGENGCASPAEEAEDDDTTLKVLELDGPEAAVTFMQKEYYKTHRAQLVTDSVKILISIYQPYMLACKKLKRKSADGKLVRDMGVKLNELQGWVAMVKVYNAFRQLAPSQQAGLAELWSGIGDWAK
ncbi:MAG: zinc ribbon domain-containing protein [Clostridiales bacterium]|jgi:hypothetical protein|nr:zinc ribbon domain-containing protein [Clostridiales bacterium]